MFEASATVHASSLVSKVCRDIAGGTYVSQRRSKKCVCVCMEYKENSQSTQEGTTQSRRTALLGTCINGRGLYSNMLHAALASSHKTDGSI